MEWDWWVIIVIVVVLAVAPCTPPHWRYISGAKRRAMLMAMRAARELHGAEIIWMPCHIRRCNRKKCFVLLQHKSIGRPEPWSVFVVWHGDHQTVLLVAADGRL